MTIIMEPSNGNLRKKKKKKNKGKGKKASEKDAAPAGVVRSTVAPLYNEDIGTEGLKRKRSGGGGPILSYSNHGGIGVSSSSSSSSSATSFQVVVDNTEETKRRKRMKRFDQPDDDIKNKKVEDAVLSSLSTQRRRDGNAGNTGSRNRNSNSNNNWNDKDCVQIQQPLIGTSTAIEKSYLRLTTAPKSCEVRPLIVLQKSLVHIKAHYVQHDDFEYANEQLKSIRQDITVQHLRNEFVLNVYETHARILLEHGDLNEFNQCQTIIRSLVVNTNSPTIPNDDDDDTAVTTTATSSISTKIRKKMKTSQKHNNNKKKKEGMMVNNYTGDDTIDNDANSTGIPILLQQSKETADEFHAYNLLYDVIQNSWCDLTVRIFTTLATTTKKKRRRKTPITNEEGNDNKNNSNDNHNATTTHNHRDAVVHAMGVIKSIIHHDYYQFFKLYTTAPHMSVYLMDFLVRRVRDNAYARMIASYRPSVSVETIRENLHFHDLQEARQYLNSKNKSTIYIVTKDTTTDDPPFWIDCKATYVLQQQQQQPHQQQLSSLSGLRNKNKKGKKRKQRKKQNK